MFTICLDPGHGKYENRSPFSETFTEGSNNYYHAQSIKEELEKYECKVVLTRNDITENPSLYERAKIASDAGADTFFSIHSNAYTNQAAKGISIFYSVTTPNLKSFCDDIGDAITSVFNDNGANTYNRGSFIRTQSDGKDWYGVIRNSIALGVPEAYIIEHGFHTNPDDFKCINDIAIMKEAAKAEAEQIALHYGLRKRSIPGDVNGDGKVNTADDILFQRYLAGWNVDIDVEAADINGDGKIDALDQILLQRMLAGWDKDGSEKPEKGAFAEGDKVMINSDVTTFANGTAMQEWVKAAALYVRGIESDGDILLLSTEPEKDVYTGRVYSWNVNKID